MHCLWIPLFAGGNLLIQRALPEDHSFLDLTALDERLLVAFRDVLDGRKSVVDAGFGWTTRFPACSSGSVCASTFGGAFRRCCK
jgi:hypothetical protein